MFSAPLGQWLAFAFSLLLLALVLGNFALLSGAVFLLMAVLVTVTLAGPRGVALSREIPRSVCWAGDTLDVNRRLEVGGGLGLVYVYDPLPGETEVVRGSNLRTVWHWPGSRTYDLSYRVRCPKRGLFHLGQSVWESEAALDLRQRRRGSGGAACEIAVVPRTQSIRRVGQVRGRAHSRRLGKDVSVTGASTTDFAELRPYASGDPMRSVNWKASARNSGAVNPLLVNQYEPEGRKAVWIFLDGADYMEVGPALSPLVDDAAEAAGAIAHYYLTRGYTLGAYIYNADGGLLIPEMGRKQFLKLADMLTRLRPGASRQNLLEAVEVCKGFLFSLKPEIYVITRLDAHYSRWGTDLPAQAGFFDGIRRLRSLRPRSRAVSHVRVVHLESTRTQDPATTLGGLSLSVMSREVEPLVGDLRRSRVSVLRWDPLADDFATVLMKDFYATKVIR